MSIKPNVRMQIRNLSSQYLKFSQWLNSFSSAFTQYAEITDVLYELHKEEVNKILEERIDAEKTSSSPKKTVQEEGTKGEEIG